MVNQVTTTNEVSLDDLLRSQAHERKVATMPYDVQLKQFLNCCNRRGSAYRPGFHQYPNLSQLSLYCGCTVPTIFRIATGETRFPSFRILTVINAVACICPAAVGGNLDEELRARIADADRWVKSDKTSRGDIMDALSAGIELRLRSTLN